MEDNKIYKKKQNLLNFPEGLEVPLSFYKDHRQLLCKNIKEQLNPVNNSIMFFRGVPTIPVDDQDIQINVEQDDNFTYLFGVEEPDCYALIDIDTQRTIIFVPKFHEDYKIWMTVKEDVDYKKEFQVDVVYVDQIEDTLKEINPSLIYIYDGVNSDSGLRPRQIDLKFLTNYKINNIDLYDVINEQRVIKDEMEIELCRFIARISSEAHIKVMKEVKKGLKEYQMAALFRFYCGERCGAFLKSYDCICASGEGCATLHYVTNDKTLGENDLILNDMGSKYKGYCSDITCTFPVSGKFTEKQKQIYNAVWEATQAVHKEAKEGVKWDDMHLLAERIILEHLVKLNIVKNSPMAELQEKRVGAVFFPHGLGHLLGMRVHDVGGYSKNAPERRKENGLKNLRMRRVLQAGTVLTIEPGCYFMKVNLERAFNNPELAPYLNKEVIDQYMEVGGVRIEDDVVIRKDGVENLTHVPRTIEQIEKCMNGEEWE